MILTSRTRC